MGKALFITGTGTDVGKTYVTGLIVRALHDAGCDAAYYKAAMSGNKRGADGTPVPGDAVQVKTMSGIGQPLGDMCPYVYETAVSPHLASRIEGGPVERDVVLAGFDRVRAAHEYVTMEGSGGILCPLRYESGDASRNLMLEDIVMARDMGCLMVADAGLGTINAVALTAEHMAARGIALLGIIFNRYRPGDMLHEDNRRMCEALTGVPVIACVRDGDAMLDMPVDELRSLYA